MKRIAILIAVGVLAQGCAGSPISPDRVTAANSSLGATQTAALGTSTMSTMAVLPPINPTGISCPTDAPQVRVGTFGNRVDIDFSEVFGATKYQIAIEKFVGSTKTVEILEVAAPAGRYEWYGEPGYHYEVKVRTLNCAGFGNWSESVGCFIDRATQTQVPGPPSRPACEMQSNFNVESLVDVARLQGGLMFAYINTRFESAGNWRIEFVGHHDEYVAQNLRPTGGQVVVSEDVELQCGESQIVKLQYGEDSRHWWWYRVYRDGVLVSTSDLY
jgi:hypothetical protein